MSTANNVRVNFHFRLDNYEKLVGDIHRIIQVLLNIFQGAIMLGFLNINIDITYNMFNKLLLFTLHDSSLIISDEVKQNL